MIELTGSVREFGKKEKEKQNHKNNCEILEELINVKICSILFKFKTYLLNADTATY